MGTAWLGATIPVAWFLVLVGALRAAQPTLARRPELSRKILHLGMGAICLPFPWLFADSWPVVALGVGFVLALVAARDGLPPRRLLGGLLDQAGRSPVGELCFPVAVAAVFWASHGNPAIFWPPLLLLSVADAAAALAGQARTAHRFFIGNGSKSLEGSLAFLAAAVPCTVVPLLMVGPAPLHHALLIALALAPLATILEATAPNGWDNLLVPLGTFVLLDRFMVLEPAALLAWLILDVLLFCGLTAAIGCLMPVWRAARLFVVEVLRRA
jgi:phytol kinase